jgi:hypothetical protein
MARAVEEYSVIKREEIFRCTPCLLIKVSNWRPFAMITAKKNTLVLYRAKRELNLKTV